MEGETKDYDKVVKGYGRNHAGAKELASGYTAGKRRVEYMSLIASAVLHSYALYILVRNFKLQNFPWMLISFLLGLILADFVSGIFHWGADSWGSVELPVIGKALIRPFREHHIDPLSILRHDFVETNADNFLMTLLPQILICYIIYHQTPEEIGDWYNVYSFLFCFAILMGFSNQFHKWAHTSEDKLPRVVIWLQKCHLILPPKHHRNHHISPHEMYFCPCNGLCNYSLEMIGFWTKLEKLIEKITGVRARSDDMKWAQKT